MEGAYGIRRKKIRLAEPQKETINSYRRKCLNK